jgi:hypothetical protein
MDVKKSYEILQSQGKKCHVKTTKHSGLRGHYKVVVLTSHRNLHITFEIKTSSKSVLVFNVMITDTKGMRRGDIGTHCGGRKFRHSVLVAFESRFDPTDNDCGLRWLDVYIL